MRGVFIVLSALALFAVPMVSHAAGPHDNNCVECHSLHNAKGDFIFEISPNASEKYRGSGAPAGGTDALCLGCHNEDEGIIPIHLDKSHPVGLKPVKVSVPPEALGGEGRLKCTSCHDPHPSNANYKYLKVDTEGGKRMGLFCAYCHGDKVDKSEL